MSHARMIVLQYLVSKLCPFDYFFLFSCTPHIVWQNLSEFWEDLELDFKLFFIVDSGSAYIVLQKSE